MTMKRTTANRLTKVGSKMTNRNNSNTPNHPVPAILIVGSGLTGAICCHRIRSLLSNQVRIEVVDMARGAGGRMSTTRQNITHIGNGTGQEIKANTGAQYASCVSARTKNSLFEVWHNRRIRTRRHLHSLRDPGGTNNLVKQFLYAGKPDVVSFETRLTKLWKTRTSGDGTTGTSILPQFDLRRSNTNNTSLRSEYNAVVLALPPKDAVKFFHQNNRGQGNFNNRHDPQSQADLHRRYNKSNHSSPAKGIPIILDTQVTNKLRKVQYIGRYSLVLWFNCKPGLAFAQNTFHNWQRQRQNNHHNVLDAVFLQGDSHVLVAQSTVPLWRHYSGVSAGGGLGGGKQKQGKSAGNSLNQISGGGRQAVRTILTQALEQLAGGSKIPNVAHAKLLNWRTSQVEVPLAEKSLATENGQIVFTGDWCTESSFEGCFAAADAAAQLVAENLRNEEATSMTA